MTRLKKKCSDLLIRLYAKWQAKLPLRTVRHPIRIILTKRDRQKNPRLPYMRPRDLGGLLRCAGYTDGDKIVVMLEKDFQRVHDLAARKINSALDAIVWYQLEHDHLEMMKDMRDIDDYEQPLDDKIS